MEPQKRKQLLLALVVVTGLLVIFFCSTPRKWEPTHEGRSLSKWVTDFGFRKGSDRDRAAVALRAIGTNALPWLLGWTASEAGPWRLKAEALAEKLAPHLPDPLAWRLNYFSLDRNSRTYAVMISFQALGSLATPAVPELEHRLFRNHPESYDDRAAFALRAIGATAVPILTNAFARRFAAGDQNCVRYLAILGTNDVLVLPIVMAGCRDPDTVRAIHSVELFGQFQAAGVDEVTPHLVTCLSDPRVEIRVAAVKAINHFGPPARAALPALTNALHDTEAVVRIQAYATIEALTVSTVILDFFKL